MWVLFDVFTAMISYKLYGSLLYAILAFIFSPLAWIYWLVTHAVNVSLIVSTFSWFFK